MVFTQSRGFVLGASFGWQCRSLRCRVLVRNAADTASLAARFLFGKLNGVAMTFGFGEKRCRKNLPLAARKMSIVELLLDTARADTELLITNDEHGDQFTVPRTVDFLLIADTAEAADTVASFITDNRYAECRIEETDDGKFRILAQLEMPITQNVACAVSGLFACVSKIFNVEYDGWGCEIRSTPSGG